MTIESGILLNGKKYSPISAADFSASMLGLMKLRNLSWNDIRKKIGVTILKSLSSSAPPLNLSRSIWRASKIPEKYKVREIRPFTDSTRKFFWKNKKGRFVVLEKTKPVNNNTVLMKNRKQFKKRMAAGISILKIKGKIRTINKYAKDDFVVGDYDEKEKWIAYPWAKKNNTLKWWKKPFSGATKYGWLKGLDQLFSDALDKDIVLELNKKPIREWNISESSIVRKKIADGLPAMGVGVRFSSENKTNWANRYDSEFNNAVNKSMHQFRGEFVRLMEKHMELK